jgi:hypothetical protein
VKICTQDPLAPNLTFLTSKPEQALARAKGIWRDKVWKNLVWTDGKKDPGCWANYSVSCGETLKIFNGVWHGHSRASNCNWKHLNSSLYARHSPTSRCLAPHTLFSPATVVWGRCCWDTTLPFLTCKATENKFREVRRLARSKIECCCAWWTWGQRQRH